MRPGAVVQRGNPKPTSQHGHEVEYGFPRMDSMEVHIRNARQRQRMRDAEEG